MDEKLGMEIKMLGMINMLQVNFYTKENCLLCDDAYALLMLFQEEYAFHINLCDIYKNDMWLEEYQLMIPVVAFGDISINGAEMSYEKLMEGFERHFAEIRK